MHFALLHHGRAPSQAGEARAPLRGVDLVAVASAFAALIAPRPYRLQPFNARGAADQLCEEAAAGRFDPRAVKLLIHCLRGARGPLREVRLPKRSTGFRPARNHHGTPGGDGARLGA